VNITRIITVLEYKGENVFISPITEPNSVMFLDLRFHEYMGFLAQMNKINFTRQTLLCGVKRNVNFSQNHRKERPSGQ
jgi:hypothetical protein